MTLLWQRRGHGHLQPLAISFSQEIFGLWIVGLWDIYFATSPFLPSYLSYWVNLALDVVWIHSWLSDFLLVSLCSSSLNSLMTVAPRRHWDKADRKRILNLVVFPCFFFKFTHLLMWQLWMHFYLNNYQGRGSQYVWAFWGQLFLSNPLWSLTTPVVFLLFVILTN